MYYRILFKDWLFSYLSVDVKRRKKGVQKGPYISDICGDICNRLLHSVSLKKGGTKQVHSSSNKMMITILDTYIIRVLSLN